MESGFIKLGEWLETGRVENFSSIAPIVNDAVIEEHFKKMAFNLKKIAPKAEDFLYFSAIMMHAAEASALNEDGTPKVTNKGEPIKVGWNKDNGSWRWVTNDASVKPYRNCFIAGTQILMEDGTSKNIEDIIPGDMVITHNVRSKKVLKTFITPHNGNLIELHIRNGRKIVTTDNHPFYRLSVNVPSNREDTPKHLFRQKNAVKTSEFVEVKNLNKYDILLSPVLNEQDGTELNSDSAKLLGYFAAEGCYSKKYNKYQGVRFTFNINEAETLAIKVKDLAYKIFPDCSVNIHKEKGNTSCVYITGHGVVDFFRNNVGEYSEHKILSRDLVFGSPEVKTNFILGWLEGDGHVSKDHGQIIGSTVSKNMASQIRVMLNSLEINHSFRFIQVEEGQTRIINENYGPSKIHDNYRIEICASSAADLIKNSEKLNFTNRGKDKKQNGFYNNYALYTIADKLEITYQGDLYNFEVEEDNSYVANDIIVHNCNGDIFPEEELVKAFRKWVGRPLCIDHKSDSVDHVRGFIVDTYYDRNLKRVVALCALDKCNYPDLARKVATGYSTAVSMGTAVGRAICSDCGQVARTEKDFCNHMRSKSCYGEINIDLSPIELSIVVNGADPQAKIKHIIASQLDALNNYVDSKEKELTKLSSSSVNSDDLMNLRKDLDDSMGKLAKLEKDILEENSKKDTNDLALNQTASTVSMQETDLPNTDFNIAPPAQRFASEDDALIEDLQLVTASIEAKLTEMKKSLDKLANHSTSSKKEEIMSGTENLNKNAFYQGTEEPTPGQAKYPKEPQNEKLRDNTTGDGDKHMNAHDTGPVDSLFPGDLETKKMLARAQSEERALRRQSAVAKAKEALEKKSYWQGGGGANEPSPGKTKYAPEKMNEDLREDDKHMVGRKPFPGVGPVDDLFPNDRKLKEQLKRATPLRARFVKAANDDGTQNLDDSSWEVYLGDKLLLTASVSDLSGKRSELLYDTIATKEFGTKLIEKVKVFGVDKVSNMYKTALISIPKVAQMPPAPPPAPDAPPPAAEPAMDTGKEGDPKETVKDLMAKTQDVVGDLSEAVNALTGEQSEMGDLGELGKAASDNVTTNTLNKMRVELNGALLQAMKEAVAELKDHGEELKLISSMYDKGSVNDSNGEFVNSIVEDAITDAKTSLADSFKLMSAFVKYARGTEAIVKRAQLESELNNLADEGTMGLPELNDMGAADSNLIDMINDTDDDLSALKEEMLDAHDGSSDEHCVDSSSSSSSSDDANDLKAGDVKPETELDPSAFKTNGSFDLNTKEGRTAYRAKLASEMFETSPHLHEAHPKGGFTTDLDVKPSDDLAKVEDLEEQHDAMMDVATAPPKVRKEAEAIQQLVVEGKLNPDDVDGLVAEGLDKDAVAYWKKFYGQAGSEGSQFASELVKEHAKAKMEEELNAHKVKLARSYELTYDMVDRGLCAKDRLAITAQVEEIMKFNDDGFESLKRVVAKHSTLTREAGRMPQVGLIGSGETVSSSVDSGNLFDQLNAAFSKTSKRVF